MSIRVLLIDEHEEARAALTERLARDDGIEIAGTVAGPAEAAATLRQDGADLVLLDIPASDGSGPDALRELRRVTQAPIVVLITMITPALWAQAKAAGASDYLLKHIDSARLRREIRRMAKQYAQSPQAS